MIIALLEGKLRLEELNYLVSNNFHAPLTGGDPHGVPRSALVADSMRIFSISAYCRPKPCCMNEMHSAKASTMPLPLSSSVDTQPPKPMS